MLKPPPQMRLLVLLQNGQSKPDKMQLKRLKMQLMLIRRIGVRQKMPPLLRRRRLVV
jgi:hypothetical protein